MKVRSSLSAACLLIAASSFAHDSGFYTGVGAIFSQFDVGMRANGVNGADSASAHFSKQTTQITGRLLGGYQHALAGNTFFTTEFFFMPRDSVKKISGFALHAPADGTATQAEGQLKLSRDYTVGLTFKYGRYFDSKTAAFIGLSLQGSRFTTTYRDAAQSVNYKRGVFGASPTVGLSYHVKPKLPVSLSYAYDIYAPFKTKDLDASGADDSLHFKLKNRYHMFMVSVSCMM